MFNSVTKTLVGLISISGVSSQSVSFGEWGSGITTFYTDTSDGSCSYGSISTNSFPYGYTIAPNDVIFADSDGCGQCYEVQCSSVFADDSDCGGCTTDSSTGENKVVTVMVTDECPTCASGSSNQFDLSECAFAVIADTECGVINIEYRQVSCDISSNIKLTNKNGISDTWYGFYVSNVANYGEISKVEIKDSSGSATWTEGESTSSNGWIFTSDSGFETPFSVRLTDSSDSTLTSADVVTSIDDDATFDFGDNFEVDGMSNLITIYQIFIPICIHGVTYTGNEVDEAIVEATGTLLSGYQDNDYGIVEVSLSTGDDDESYNITLLVETQTPLPVTTSALNGTLCNVVGPAIDSQASCSVCDEVMTDTIQREESQDSESNDSHDTTDDENNEDAGYRSGNVGMIAVALNLIILALSVATVAM